MRKEIIASATQEQKPSHSRWIEVGNLARVEITSEDAAHPIESVFRAGTGTSAGPGWLAAQPGTQTIRLIFDAPVALRQIYLEFVEPQTPRTQEFVLRWSPDGSSYREIVRQQYNFNPPGTSSEREEYRVDLSGVSRVELTITPAIGRSDVRASLTRMLLA
jgi:uncharacterized protein YndB with AHSA1/START domain